LAAGNKAKAKEFGRNSAKMALASAVDQSKGNGNQVERLAKNTII
jgi:hypothetical protein